MSLMYASITHFNLHPCRIAWGRLNGLPIFLVHKTNDLEFRNRLFLRFNVGCKQQTLFRACYCGTCSFLSDERSALWNHSAHALNQGKPLAVTPARFTAASESKAKRACAGFLTGPVSNRNQLVCPPVLAALAAEAARFDFMGKNKNPLVFIHLRGGSEVNSARAGRIQNLHLSARG